MYFLLFIFLLFLLFVLQLYIEPAALAFYLDTNSNKAVGCFKWLPAQITMQFMNTNRVLTLQLFGKRLFTIILKPKSRKKKMKTDAYRSVSLSDLHIHVRYGLDNPFLTGITCTMMEMLRSMQDQVEVIYDPDFMPEDEYVIASAEAKLNIGKTLNHYLRQKLNIQS